MTKRRHKGYGAPTGKYAAVPLSVINTPAWRAMGTSPQALFVWLLMEWKGPKFNNNGKITLSVRQAAERMGVSRDTAAKAFRDLQAKGFIEVKKGGSLGLLGHGKCPEFEITSLVLPGRNASQKYLSWTTDNDFPIFKHPTKNPNGKNRTLS